MSQNGTIKIEKVLIFFVEIPKSESYVAYFSHLQALTRDTSHTSTKQRVFNVGFKICKD